MKPCIDKAQWHGLYRRDYDLQVPESMAHPAKMSWDLCFRILAHLKELGLLKEGDTVLDPMAGTGRTAIAACSLGYQAVTVELEEKFVGFERQNLEYASRKLGRPLDWTILQGDARKLGELLQERGLRAVMSPPYQDSVNREGEWGISLDPQKNSYPQNRSPEYVAKHQELYGTSPGQIGNLKDRPLKAVMSPPYAEAQTGGGIVKTGYKDTGDDVAARCGYMKAVLSPPYADAINADKGGIDWEKAHRPDRLPKNNPAPSVQGTQELRYSHDRQNIGNLPDRPLKCVTSPPYESGGHHADAMRAGGGQSQGTQPQYRKGYGDVAGQILGDGTYLEAMRQVYAEIAKVADVLCVVTKNPTRAGKLRRLDLDTIALLEETGWQIVCRHEAMLFEEQETADLFGQSVKRPKGRLSFFKRLSYQKGSPVADHEDVLVCVKSSQEALL